MGAYGGETSQEDASRDGAGRAMAGNLERLEARIEAACRRAARSSSEVTLIWVGKTHSVRTLEEALKLGATHFGENKVQEAAAKFPLSKPCTLHFIGHLQRNKVRKILPLARVIHSVDSWDLLHAIQRISDEQDLDREIFFQVNISGEASKGGFDPEVLLRSLRDQPPTPRLRWMGLMAMAGLQGGAPAARRCFGSVRGLLRELREGSAAHPGMAEMKFLSMGMTGDFEVAIEEGSHYIRIGTALFGPRTERTQW